MALIGFSNHDALCFTNIFKLLRSSDGLVQYYVRRWVIEAALVWLIVEHPVSGTTENSISSLKAIKTEHLYMSKPWT